MRTRPFVFHEIASGRRVAARSRGGRSPPHDSQEQHDMARTTPRPRRQLNPTVIRGLTPVIRYSPGREAYVLRGVGGRFGPVLVPKREVREPEYAKHSD